MPTVQVPSAVQDGSAVVLGFLAWVWVVLPFIQGGPSRVWAVLGAKFVNQIGGVLASGASGASPQPSGAALPDYGAGAAAGAGLQGAIAGGARR